VQEDNNTIKTSIVPGKAVKKEVVTCRVCVIEEEYLFPGFELIFWRVKERLFFYNEFT
jgi:hypothetical protein